MPRSPSRSASPRREERRGSRSPCRRHNKESDRPRRREGGFRWKDKRRTEDSGSRDNERGLSRGYRERDRARSPRRDWPQDVSRDSEEWTRGREEREHKTVPIKHGEMDNDIPAQQEIKKKEMKEKKASASINASEPMI